MCTLSLVDVSYVLADSEVARGFVMESCHQKRGGPTEVNLF